MSRFLKLLTAVAAVAVLAALVVGIRFAHFLDAPVEVSAAGTELEIRPGMSFRQVSDELGERGIISQPTFFRAIRA